MLSFGSQAQERTVGLLEKSEGYFEGYTLFSPAGNTTTYLVNDCGQLVHRWDSDYQPGNSVYLMDDGSIFRASRVDGARLGEPGVGGRIEKISWNNEVLWSWEYANDTANQHHDFHVLPNGNVLVLAWDLRTFEEAVQAGRDPETLSDNELWPDHVIEVNPVGSDQGEIVWVWDSWDHLVQDFDITKDNYGVVGDAPGKIDVNYRLDDGADWHHINSINYDPVNKHIILSSPFFNEIWIIDHDISTQEAKGVKGDLLFRWGNPEVYRQGTDEDQKLFFQHTAEWLPAGLQDEGKIIIFNNGRGRVPDEYSSVVVLDPFNQDGEYYLVNGAFGPDQFVSEYVASTPTDFYAAFISSAQQLPNGNLLINDGPVGTFFEVMPDGSEVWRYKNPVSITAGIVDQGAEVNGNLVFRAQKFPLTHPAFNGRNLESIGFVEGSGVDIEGCATPLGEEEITVQFLVYPNPAMDKLLFNKPLTDLEVFNISGKLQFAVANKVSEIDVSNLSPGMYVLKSNEGIKKFQVNRK